MKQNFRWVLKSELPLYFIYITAVTLSGLLLEKEVCVCVCMCNEYGQGAFVQHLKA